MRYLENNSALGYVYAIAWGNNEQVKKSIEITLASVLPYGKWHECKTSDNQCIFYVDASIDNRLLWALDVAFEQFELLNKENGGN